MNKTKKTIVREGAIFLCFFMLANIGFALVQIKWVDLEGTFWGTGFQLWLRWLSLTGVLYLVYLVIHFISWATKTLKEQ